MARKALLAAIAVFSFSLGTGLQAVLALGVLAIALALHLMMKPFVSAGPDLNRLETISLSASFLTFLDGLIFNDPHTSQNFEIIVSVVVIGTLAGVTVFMFYELGYEICRWMNSAWTQLKLDVSEPIVPQVCKKVKSFFDPEQSVGNQRQI